MTTYELTGTDARRAAQLALIIKCKEYHPLAADDFRHQYVKQVTNGRTESSKECSLEELNAAIELVAPVLVEDFTYLDGNPPVKWVAWADSGGCYADW